MPVWLLAALFLGFTAPTAEAAEAGFQWRVVQGITYHQGEAPVSAAAQAPAPELGGAPGLGVGLEGRSPAGFGWQLLANLAPSPLVPAPDPRMVLHGFWLPHHTWGLDADVGLDPRGGHAAELGTSWLFGWEALPEHRLRLAAGQQGGGGMTPYGWGEAALAREWRGLGLTTNMTGFLGQDGAGLAVLDGARAWPLGPDLRLTGSLSGGAADPRLPAGRQLGLGLAAAGGATAGARVVNRWELAALLARRLGWSAGGLVTLAHVEGACFMEGAIAAGASDGGPGPRGGVGVQLDLLADTCLGLPLALGLGVAVPVAGPDGTPRLYVATSGPRFAR